MEIKTIIILMFSFGSVGSLGLWSAIIMQNMDEINKQKNDIQNDDRILTIKFSDENYENKELITIMGNHIIYINRDREWKFRMPEVQER